MRRRCLRREAFASERIAVIEPIGEDVLERYERLFKTKAGVAVTPLEHDVCMGRHMKVTTQTVVQVKGEKEIVHCPQCARAFSIAI